MYLFSLNEVLKVYMRRKKQEESIEGRIEAIEGQLEAIKGEMEISRIMEPNLRKHKAYNIAPQDFLSTMPDNVVTNIMDRLPLQDAVRTSVLATNWRLKWSLLSKLVFDRNFFQYLLKSKAEEKYGRIVSRLLLHFKGSITKFVLYIKEGSKLDDEDISHWFLFLSEKGIKYLTIKKMNPPPLKLPTHLFSCLELKHLKLHNCSINPPSSFYGFPNLFSLKFSEVQIKRSKFGELITCCPLLEILNMRFFNSLDYKVKLVEIAKLANLKVLSFSLFNIDTITSTSSIFELVGSLPKLEELDLNFAFCKFKEVGDRKRSPTSFPCLKALKLRRIDLGNPVMLSYALELIRCSLNLQTLKITTCECDADLQPAIPEVEYDTMEPLQLRSVVFRDLKGLENEVYLIKYILACSPFLKKIVIHAHSSLALDEKLFTRKLLKLRRASPVAEIDIN